MIWYPGTRAPFGKGGWLSPPSFHQGARANDVPDYPGAEAYIFLTPDFEIAEAFALSALGRGRPRVLTVEPTEDVEPDVATLFGEDAPLYRSRGWAKVVNVTYVTLDESTTQGVPSAP